MPALFYFPDPTAIQFIHNATSWYEKPIHFRRILRSLAVDRLSRDLLLAPGIPEPQIRVLLNFVDLDRFRPRRQPLSLQPKRALLFSNYANEETHLPAVREACARAQIQLDVVGSQTKTTSRPEEILGEYDLVFSKAKNALKAMSVGGPCVFCV